MQEFAALEIVDINPEVERVTIRREPDLNRLFQSDIEYHS